MPVVVIIGNIHHMFRRMKSSINYGHGGYKKKTNKSKKYKRNIG